MNIICEKYAEAGVPWDLLTRSFEIENWVYPGFTLYEVENGKLVRLLDDYITAKPLDYDENFTFSVEEVASGKLRQKKFIELDYKSAYEEDFRRKI